MFLTFLKLSLRNMRQQKLFSTINIFGLAIGLTGFAIFALTAGVKLNADKFHKDAEDIHGIIQIQSSESKEEHHTAYCPPALMSALKNEFPEIEDAVRIIPAEKMILRSKEDNFFENNILFVESNFLTFFTFEMQMGNPETALSEPNSIILSEAVAKKYFGEDNPIGKTLFLKNGNQLIVTGITKNIPRTSSIKFEILIPIEFSEPYYGELNNWEKNNTTTFVRLQKDYDKKLLEGKLPAFINKFVARDPENSLHKLYLHSLLDFRLKSRHIESFLSSSNITGVIILFGLGFILLIIVSINFINLSIARYMYRIKEIGIRKVTGASKLQLIIQFLGESILTSFIALPIAIYLFDILNPIFTLYIGAPSFTSPVSHSSFSLLQYPFIFKYLVVNTLLIGIISGIYPAIILSNFHPIQALAGNKQIGKKRKIGSKAMIILQFTLSIVFIAFAGILRNQFDHLIISDFGFNRNNIAAIQVSELNQAKHELLKTEIMQNPDVISVSASGQIPIFWLSQQSVLLQGHNKDNAIKTNAYGVDNNFIEFIDLKLLHGNSLSNYKGNENNFVINETAIRKFNLDNPIGQQLKLGKKNGTVVGVVKDYVFGDIEFGMDPAILYYDPSHLNYILVKYYPTTSFKSIHEFLKNKQRSIFPDIPFNCVSLEDYFLDSLGILKKTSLFLTLLGIVAVFFSCLGLFGLTSYIVERKTKEIGIRKVLGITLSGIVWTILKEFITLVIIANILGLSIIYLSWNNILQSGLMFMTAVKPGTYFFVFFISLFTAIAAVISQTLKAALANPIESLRYE
jgi:putative ABC transport system permease protein